MSLVYPFSAIVGQDEMKLALLIAAVDQSVGGVLVFGDRGTGKSTAVRALAALLPKRPAIDMAQLIQQSGVNATSAGPAAKSSKQLMEPIPVVDLPLGATEDRLVGALDIEKALTSGEKAFEPGLLARAHGGFLYIDEVNLLEDHLVDLLLDVTASGENVVEREGLSIRHPARFVLIGSGNPEEGELRPQLLDRFGLCLEVKTTTDIKSRIEVVKRRDEFERDRAAFIERWQKEEQKTRRKIVAGRAALPHVETPDSAIERIAGLCMALGTDGLRGELTLMRAARALAALEGGQAIADKHIRSVALLALRHRLRRNPLDEVGSSLRIERALEETFA